METVAGNIEKKDQKTRHRSPNYPNIGLRLAVAKIEALYKADGLAPSQKLAAIKHMGYERLHSDAARAVSALKSFGLIEETDERIKLSQRGIDIVVRPADDPARKSAIREAAISPDIFQELLEQYRTSGLPSDSSLKSEMIAVKKFNPAVVDGLIRDFRDTLEFAGLSDLKVLDLSSRAVDRPADLPMSLKIGDYVQWESNGQLQFVDPRIIREFSADGKWAFVAGSATGLPTEELTKMEATNTEIQSPHTPPPQMRSAPPQPPASTPKGSQMRSYSWALSGDFNAKMELFGEAATEEDIDALKDYVDITIRALKRSLKAREASQG